MRTLCLTLLLIVICPLTAESQDTPEWQHLYEQLYDCDDIDSGNAEELHELLQELADSPVNLYDATPEDIDRLLFLSTEQRAELNQYISRHGHMLSMGETRMLRTIDPLRLQLLDFFAYVKAEERLNNDFPSLRDMAKYGKTTIASDTIINQKGKDAQATETAIVATNTNTGHGSPTDSATTCR